VDAAVELFREPLEDVEAVFASHTPVNRGLRSKPIQAGGDEFRHQEG
jgi:hypothetical protein